MKVYELRVHVPDGEEDRFWDAHNVLREQFEVYEPESSPEEYVEINGEMWSRVRTRKMDEEARRDLVTLLSEHGIDWHVEADE